MVIRPNSILSTCKNTVQMNHNTVNNKYMVTVIENWRSKNKILRIIGQLCRLILRESVGNECLIFSSMIFSILMAYPVCIAVITVQHENGDQSTLGVGICPVVDLPYVCLSRFITSVMLYVWRWWGRCWTVLMRSSRKAVVTLSTSSSSPTCEYRLHSERISSLPN